MAHRLCHQVKATTSSVSDRLKVGLEESLKIKVKVILKVKVVY